MSDGINDSIPGRGMRKTPMKEASGKHPQRCETCDHWKGHYDVPFCKFWDDKIPITKYGVDLISHVGCVSHSSAPQPAEQRIKDLIEYFKKRKATTVPTKQILTFDEAISLLRGN